MSKELFVHFVIFKLGSSWRQLTVAKKNRGKSQFSNIIERNKRVTTYSYSTLGLEAESDILLWFISNSLESVQEIVSELLKTELGYYLDITKSLLGLIRPSVYVKKKDIQAQAINLKDRKKYLIVYPFTKTKEWYLLNKDERQELMNEHIRIGKKFPSVRQVLAYSFGIDDQEFIVSYETDILTDFQDLVKALRETKARLYTLIDTPIFVGVYRTADEVLDLLG